MECKTRINIFYRDDNKINKYLQVSRQKKFVYAIKLISKDSYEAVYSYAKIKSQVSLVKLKFYMKEKIFLPLKFFSSDRQWLISENSDNHENQIKILKVSLSEN